jgi:hypothetical protein
MSAQLPAVRGNGVGGVVAVGQGVDAAQIGRRPILVVPAQNAGPSSYQRRTFGQAGDSAAVLR